MRFRLVPKSVIRWPWIILNGIIGLVLKSVTLNDLERRNGRYVALFHWIW